MVRTFRTGFRGAVPTPNGTTYADEYETVARFVMNRGCGVIVEGVEDSLDDAFSKRADGGIGTLSPGNLEPWEFRVEFAGDCLPPYSFPSKPLGQWLRKTAPRTGSFCRTSSRSGRLLLQAQRMRQIG